MREHRQDARRTVDKPEPEAKPPKRELEVGKITGVMALDLTDAQLAGYDVEVGKVPRARVRQVDRRADSASIPERLDDILAKLDDIRGGQRLPAALAKRLAAELGADLSDLRVHTGGDAAQMAAELGARALAIGSDIYFAAGAYDPESNAGVELIAHEVAHVAQQQRAAPVSATRVSRPEDAHERDADRFASAFVVGAKTPEVAPAPAMIARKPATGGDVWDQLFGEPSREVNKDARVSAPKGIILKVKPAPGAAAAASKLDFDASVTVARTTTQDEVAKRWAYVTTAGGTHGFIEERYLLIDPPEPSAHVHRVKAGETLGAIARDTYGSKIEEGNDERLYVQAIYEANKGKPGIYLTDVSLDTTDKVMRNKDEQETLKIYKGVKAKADHALWVPSDAFVQALKKSGKITSGSTGLRPAWDAAVNSLDPTPQFAKLKAGIAVGVFEGAYQAIVDIFKGAIEMVKLAAEVMRLQMTGELMQKVLEVAEKVWDFFSHLDPIELAKKVGEYIANKWNHASWFGKGEMIGEIVGYIAMNVLLALLTEGGSLAVELAEAAEAGSDIARLVQTFVKVVDVAQNPVKLLEGSGKAVVIGEDAAKLRQGLKEAGAARKAEHAAAETEKALEHAKTAAARVSELEKLLPEELKGRLVWNDAVGKGARISYKDGVRIEVGAGTDARILQGHIATAQKLMKFEGPLGKIHKMLNAIASKLGLAKKYGTKGFEAEHEIAKLTAIKAKLEAAQSEIEATFARVGEKTELSKAEAEKLDGQIKDVEAQIKEHQANLDSKEAGKGHIEMADAAAKIKSVVGSESKGALSKFVFQGTEEAEALTRVRVKAQKEGEEAYKVALDAGDAADVAHKKANAKIRQTSIAEARVEAMAAAERRADRAIADGSAFKDLDAKAKEQLEHFNKGATGGEAKRIAGSLSNKKENEFQAFMDHEVATHPKLTSKPVPINGPPQQTMTVWEYPDGTTVRLKPLGTKEVPHPQVTVEVKRDPSLPDTSRDDAAFKVNPAGRAVPKNDLQLQNPYPKAGATNPQYKAFEDRILGPAHYRLN